VCLEGVTLVGLRGGRERFAEWDVTLGLHVEDPFLRVPADRMPRLCSRVEAARVVTVRLPQMGALRLWVVSRLWAVKTGVECLRLVASVLFGLSLCRPILALAGLTW